MTTKEKRSIEEVVADTACKLDCDASKAIEHIAELVTEVLYGGYDIDMTDRQWTALETAITKFLGEYALDGAAELLNEWAESTRECEEARREGLRAARGEAMYA